MKCLILYDWSSDVYEGTRSARANDVASIEQLLRPLEENGILIHRSRQQVCLNAFSKCGS